MTGQPEKLWSRTEFEGSFIKVVTDAYAGTNGGVVEREVVRHPGAVAIVAEQDGSVLLVRQMRHAVGDSLMEIPAGKLEPGEDPWDTARRELEEETGMKCGSLELMVACYTTPGFTDERLWIFRAESLVQAGDPPTHDGDEPISTHRMPVDEIQAAITDGTIQDAKSIIGLTMLLLARAQGDPD